MLFECRTRQVQAVLSQYIVCKHCCRLDRTVSFIRRGHRTQEGVLLGLLSLVA